MCLEEPAERHLAGSPPLPGSAFIPLSPAGLGRPGCTDGHLAGTLGHGPVLTPNRILPSISASLAPWTLKGVLDEDGEAMGVMGRGITYRINPLQNSPPSPWLDSL